MPDNVSICATSPPVSGAESSALCALFEIVIEPAHPPRTLLRSNCITLQISWIWQLIDLDRRRIVNCRKQDLELPFDVRPVSDSEVRLWRRGRGALDSGLAHEARVKAAELP